ncbi:MAG: hypothetical protein ABL940_13435 [Bacteroidia bacterium]
MAELINFLITHKAFLGVVVSSTITFLWTAYQYLDTKKRELNKIEFENYHKILMDIVNPEGVNNYLDSQAAAIYELRHFQRYYPISCRTLIGLKKKWEEDNKCPKNIENKIIVSERLLEECAITINFLKKNRICRWFERIKTWWCCKC